jgi:pimeloyl-ACP methyl ester carboxylesterase
VARFVLVPGFWLGAWAWDEVAGLLRADGHDVQALTLPGLESAHADRSAIRLDDHVDAVVRVLEGGRDEPSILVGHSGAGAVIYAATDRAPALVQRGVYVDSGPLPDGASVGFPTASDASEIPLPSWAELVDNGTSIDGLSEDQLAEFRSRAVPHPAGPARDPLQLVDPRRFQVPVTMITSEFPAEQVRQLTAEGHPYFAELPHLDVTIVDLPTGHWAMWSRPDDLATELLRAAAG